MTREAHSGNLACFFNFAIAAPNSLDVTLALWNTLPAPIAGGHVEVTYARRP